MRQPYEAWMGDDSYNPEADTYAWVCRDCGKLLAPHKTLCKACEEDREMGYPPREEVTRGTR